MFTHKQVIGGSHKDVFFGTNVGGTDPGDLNAVTEASSYNALSSSNKTAATTKATYESQFINDLYSNGVRYFFTGHDHHHRHSICFDPLSTASNRAWVEQIVGQSASNKFYTPAAPFSPNEVVSDEQLWAVGSYIVTVDGPRTTFDYYEVPTNTGGNNVNYTPVLTGNWVKSITFGSSKNGQTFSIPQGASYTSITDSTTLAVTNAAANGEVASDYNSGGTTLNVLYGTNNSTSTTQDGRALTRNVNTGWSPALDAGTISDVATIWGLSGMDSSFNDTIVVQVSFPAATAGSGNSILLGAKDPNSGTWYNAATLDVNGNTTQNFVNGAWNSSYTTPGTYGVDYTNHVAWAVVNGTARGFAVINNPNAIKGDLNGDGAVNAADLAILNAAIAAHSTNSAYDLNGDGKVNSADVRWLTQHYTH